MAKVAEGIARVADEIASGRQQRSKLAIEIKNATRSRRSEARSLLASLKASRIRAGREQAAEAEKAAKARHGEVRSLLKSMKASRSRASREQAAEAKKATRARHGEVHSSLQGLKASRSRAAREYRGAAIVVINGRRSEVKALLAQFSRARVVRRKHRQALAVAQRDKAAAFMRDLTSGVVALRDNFAKEGRERAAAIGQCLAAYAQDRHEAVAIWRGNRHQKHPVVAHGAEASHRPAPQSSPVPHSLSAPANDVAAAQAPDTTTPSGKRPFGNLGHKGSSDRHGKDSK